MLEQSIDLTGGRQLRVAVSLFGHMVILIVPLLLLSDGGQPRVRLNSLDLFRSTLLGPVPICFRLSPCFVQTYYLREDTSRSLALLGTSRAPSIQPGQMSNIGGSRG